MNNKMISLCVRVLILGSLLLPVIGPIQAAWAAPKPLFVDVDASGANDGSSWANAYVDLQDALAATSSGRQIWVAEGVYTPGSAGDRSATFQLKNGVSVYGGFAGTETSRSQRDWEANVTVLSGDIDDDDTTNADGVVTNPNGINGSNAYHVTTGSGTDATALLDGFTVTAGQADSSPSDYRGGGMINDAGSPTIGNVTFIGNSASDGGGGMYNYDSSNPTLTNVTFSDNSAYRGGGMYNSGSNPTLTNVSFANNAAGLFGGGMHNYDSSPTLTGVIFSDNSAVAIGKGGGMSNSGSNPTLANVIFNGNTASDSGGGMYNSGSNPTLTNVTFSGNSADRGGGMASWGSWATLTNVTFSANSADDGGGMHNSSSSPILHNCILWANSASASGDQIENSGTGVPAISHSLVQGSGGSASWDASLGTNGGGNIDADPKFLDADGADNTVGTLDDDLRLGSDSPAIDAGDNLAVPIGITTDLDGAARFVDVESVPDTGSGVAPIVDMGAYEAAYEMEIHTVYLPLVLRGY